MTHSSHQSLACLTTSYVTWTSFASKPTLFSFPYHCFLVLRGPLARLLALRIGQKLWETHLPELRYISRSFSGLEDLDNPSYRTLCAFLDSFFQRLFLSLMLYSNSHKLFKNDCFTDHELTGSPLRLQNHKHVEGRLHAHCIVSIHFLQLFHSCLYRIVEPYHMKLGAPSPFLDELFCSFNLHLYIITLLTVRSRAANMKYWGFLTAEINTHSLENTELLVVLETKLGQPTIPFVGHHRPWQPILPGPRIIKNVFCTGVHKPYAEFQVKCTSLVD